MIGANPGARIAQILVKTGEKVDAGTTLVLLQGHEQATRKLEMAKAVKSRADFERKLKRDQVQQDRALFDRVSARRLARLQEVLKGLKERLAVALANRDRVTTLERNSDRVAAQDFVIAQSQTEVARTELELEELEAKLAQLADQRMIEDRELADDTPVTKVLAAQIAEAEAGVEEAVVKAPIAGTILEVVARAGEVSTGPILHLADLSVMTVEAEVDQSEITRLKVGLPARSSIFDRIVQGHVSRVSRQVGKNRLTSIDPLERVDRRVVEVIITLDEADFASRFIGMQVDVAITPISNNADATDR